MTGPPFLIDPPGVHPTGPAVDRRESPGRRVLRLRAIGCEALGAPLALCAARSPHVVHVELVRRGLHDAPVKLRAELQAAIQAAAGAVPAYDAVVLAYGLCGGATAGIEAVGVPLVLARAHDCITLFLGSRARYEAEFAAHPGTYWYVAGDAGRPVEEDRTGLLGVGATSGDELDAAYADYVARYGQDNADYLIEAMAAWRARYDRAAYIDTGIDDARQAERRARTEAGRRGWRFERLVADLALLRRLVDGDWADDFLVLRPGERLAMSYDGGVVRAEAAQARIAPADAATAQVATVGAVTAGAAGSRRRPSGGR